MPRKNYTPKMSMYKKHAIRAATELGYNSDVINKVKSCDNDTQISQIMTQARKNGGILDYRKES